VSLSLNRFRPQTSVVNDEYHNITGGTRHPGDVWFNIRPISGAYLSDLENYYNEHATQARQHEDQREHMTNIVLAVSGVLVGLVTYSELSLWSLPAALTLVILGLFGFVFAGKHYERFRFHTEIMSAIRAELDRVRATPNSPVKSLSQLRSDGATQHYSSFKWPKFSGTNSVAQAGAQSWIARQRLHVFWEFVHILVAVIGIGLCVAIVAKTMAASPSKPLKIQIVK
jgi:hypothetical protein